MRNVLLIVLVALCFSCQKPGSAQTRLYTEDGMEVLNGQVKEIFSGDSSSKLGEYHKYDFNGKGDLESSVEKGMSIVSTQGSTDTTISVNKRQYLVNIDNKGLMVAIRYGLPDDKVADYSVWLRFDKHGHLATDGDPHDSTAYVTYYQCDTAGYTLKSTLVFGQNKTEPIVNKYKYDKQHLLIEMTDYEGMLLDKATYKYTEFDSHHNWIKRICHWENYNPGGHFPPTTTTVTRKITYY